ncbi:MAG: 2-oxoglutarate dehydrogenase complex dihydrolipoyllysine-residue succinyltransferase [Acidobacteria bacterium]|nr:2-oxoglutarate dehydrogenase complex dihydrolipoyllysine-residue succinyltransferase [Acidobacteriota bacterium]
MRHEIKVPHVGESVSEVRIARWLKQDGEPVAMDEPILELETDKANMELSAESAGILRIQKAAGQTVVPGQVLGFLEEVRVELEGATTAKAPAGSAAGSKPVDIGARRSEVSGPAVRKLLREHDIDIVSISGTGRGGRVRKEDVLNFVKTRAAETAAYPGTAPVPRRTQPSSKPSGEPKESERERIVPMSLLRQKISERMVKAQQTAAILTTFNEIDMFPVMELRAKHKETFQQTHGVRLGLMSFFVKATVEALQVIPVLNARVDGNNIVCRNYYDVGVAVATDRGLVVPVLRDADKMTFPKIEIAIEEYARRAREGTLTVDELTGGTFTITNGGVFGSLFSTPILNPPQSGILGMHVIQKRAVVVDDQIVIRPMMYVALSYDHRIVDGKEAVTFLKRIKECIEDPPRLMLSA